MNFERQGEFVFVDGWVPASNSERDPPRMLDDEIAAVWGLPVGHRVEVQLRDHDLPAMSGLLEIAAAPDLPFDRRQALALRIGHVLFTNRQIASWTLP